ncbi:MAG: hypothetical protein NTY47_03490 [Candidatus Omnitrophica bacterium]|nr:hypothetical protein [Candidatus Omnitrophota bacterium]
MSRINIVLSITKQIRGSKINKGTVIFEGECAKNFTIADVDKAIKNQEINIVPVAEKK